LTTFKHIKLQNKEITETPANVDTVSVQCM
jgi:hypothetical protein